jgi:NADPH:quinone reductase-like Zn-dependent oxidoreductase
VILDGTFDVYAPLNLEVAADDATVSILQYEDSRGVAELPGNLLSPALWKDLTIQLVGGPNADPPSYVLDRLAVLFARDELSVDIEESYSLADVPRAQEKMANEHFVGKLVVEP